jgi:hypothetical protein
MEWQHWSSVCFVDRDQLPSEPGLYVVVDSENFVWYVGKASNLQNRWTGRGHHRYPQLVRSHKKLQHRIYWKPVPASQLDESEKLYIERFEPELNGLKVKTYLPKESQVHREIKRLLKVLNKTTFLFPLIRSVVAGEYTDDLGNRCVVIITNLNDWRVLDKSIRKRYSQKVRNAWIGIETYCRFSGKEHKPLIIPAYAFQGYRFEFITIPEIIFYFEKSVSAQVQWLQSAEIFEVPVRSLKGFDFLEELNLEESYRLTYSDGRRSLKDVAYLRYMQSELKPISQESQDFVLPRNLN